MDGSRDEEEAFNATLPGDDILGSGKEKGVWKKKWGEKRNFG